MAYDLIVSRIVARWRSATTFPTEKALQEYLRTHPKADKSKHHVLEQEDSTKKLEEHDRKNPGSIDWSYDPKKKKDKDVADETKEEHEARLKRIKDRK